MLLNMRGIEKFGWAPVLILLECRLLIGAQHDAFLRVFILYLFHYLQHLLLPPSTISISNAIVK